MSRLMAWSVMKSASYVCIERVITRYRAFCYVQAYAPIQSARVSIERLARRIDVPTTFGVGVLECIGVGCLARTKAPAHCCCCAVRTPFQTTPHLTSLDRSARQPTTHKQSESKNTRSIWQLYSSPSAVSSKVPSSISSPRPFSLGTRKANTPTPVSVLLVNAIAVLSEDRFLARSTYSTITPA